ncbi:uncharacterized protein LOC123546311 [Mercenaria mercenaria]|uniref:uncharacterized protein LOC123546311 n=1 Tax=Mercenaria mercenaria TaxID=6596 RepID=UPI00234FAD81|nr:uncharacterized protein LOC123546311 [Mercenaria mercenaria]
MCDEEDSPIHNREKQQRDDLDLDSALEKQRNIFLEELENRFSSISSKKASSDSSFTFKNEGNKIQVEFNCARIDGLKRIADICTFSPDLVKSTATKEIDELKQRNKLLKIADKHGWDTVREYTDNPLADNSEDAANLRAAIARAMRNRRFNPYQRTSTSTVSSANQQQKAQGPFRGFQTGYEGGMSKRFGTGFSQTRRADVGPCFACHLQGHFARQCPYVQRNTVRNVQELTTRTGENADSIKNDSQDRN